MISSEHITLAIIAFLNLATAVLTIFTHKQIAKVEENTNSMKDALVASTAKASLAQGTAAGLKEGRSEPRRRRK
jgi:hypothetical protein